MTDQAALLQRSAVCRPAAYLPWRGVKTALYILGACFELIGIVLVASPDLLPFVVPLARAWRRFRYRVGGPFTPRPIVYKDAPEFEDQVNMRANDIYQRVPVSTGGKFAYLFGRDEETQHDMNKLRNRVEDLETEVARGIAALRDELVTHVSDKVAAAQADYRFVRRTGAITLLVGLVLSTWGNLAT